MNDMVAFMPAGQTEKKAAGLHSISGWFYEAVEGHY
jgi:hypothetical protein